MTQTQSARLNTQSNQSESIARSMIHSHHGCGGGANSNFMSTQNCQKPWPFVFSVTACLLVFVQLVPTLCFFWGGDQQRECTGGNPSVNRHRPTSGVPCWECTSIKHFAWKVLFSSFCRKSIGCPWVFLLLVKEWLWLTHLSHRPRDSCRK